MIGQPEAVVHASPLRPELLAGVDMIVVRELTGGIYFGDKKRDGDRASDLCVYTVAEVERIVRTARAASRAARRKKLTSVDKANVLETSRLWREVTDARDAARSSPTSRSSHMLVDACAMHLIRRPADFDVIVTENMFGDILTDEASMLAGLDGDAAVGLAGRGQARPLRADPRLGARHRGQGHRQPLRHHPERRRCCCATRSGLEAEARAVEAAVAAAIDRGVLTGDLAPPGTARRHARPRPATRCSKRCGALSARRGLVRRSLALFRDGRSAERDLDAGPTPSTA